MSTTVTVVTLGIALLAFLRELPRRKETRQIWGLCMLSGVFGLLVPGGAFVLQLIQSLLQALLLGCCLLAMRRERVSRERRSRFFHCRRHAAIYKPRAAAPNGPRRVGRCA